VNYFCLIFLFILTINPLAAVEQPIILAKDHLPYEFKLLTSATNRYMTSVNEHYELVEDLKIIDAALSPMKKEEQFFFIKSEIYKEILRSKPDTNPPTRYIDPKTLTDLDAKAFEFKDNEYVSWLIQSIRDDLTPLLSSSMRNTYLFQIQSKTPITDMELTKYQRKIKILLPWAVLFLQKSPDEIDVFCKDLVKRSLASIKLSLVEFNKINKTKLPSLVSDIYKLSNFTVRNQAQIAAEKSGELEKELLETDFNKSEAKIAKDGWVPRTEDDNLQNNAALNPDPFPTPDPNYIPPVKLPAAKNDWEKEYLYPNPDPKYQAPKELPQAKNDWEQEYLYPTPDPDYIPPSTMPVPVKSWESVRP